MRNIRPSNKEEFGRDLKEIFNLNLNDDSEEKARNRLKEVAIKWKKLFYKI